MHKFIVLALILGRLLAGGVHAQTPIEGSTRTVITAAMMENNPPFTASNPQHPTGQSGLLVEILDEIFKLANMPYAIEVYPWARAQAQVQAGRADILVTVPTVERQGYAQASEIAVFPMVMQIYARKDHPRLSDIRRIKSTQDIVTLDLVAISNLGNGWHKANIEAAGVKTYYGTNDESAARMLAARRGDILIDSAVSMALEIRRQGLEGVLTAAAAPYAPLRFHVLLSHKSPFVSRMPDINRAVQTLQKNGTLERLYLKYTRLD